MWLGTFIYGSGLMGSLYEAEAEGSFRVVPLQRVQAEEGALVQQSCMLWGVPEVRPLTLSNISLSSISPLIVILNLNQPKGARDQQ